MHSVYEADIDGDPEAICRLIADVEAWPRLFPHVAAVEVFWRGGDSIVARVHASRSGFPVRWVCRRQADPASLRVSVEHVDGFARGLRAVWTFAAAPDRRATARLAIDYRPRHLRDRWLAPFVLDDLVARTIAMLTLLAESDRAAHELRDADSNRT